MNFSLISYLFLFCLLGAIFFLVKFDITQKYPNIINIAMADTINGTENADNITGTINKDVIKGLNGNDTITGKEAGDDISGGSGDDIIYGNEGRDILRGKAGNDRIEGGEGNDRIYGDRGNDILVGGPGNDTLTGGLGKDVFICGTATDTITDFNFTQEDSIPENDCEKVKYEGNTKVVSKTSSSIQQEQSPNVGNVMDINEEITPSKNNSNNEKTLKEEKKIQTRDCFLVYLNDYKKYEYFHRIIDHLFGLKNIYNE